MKSESEISESGKTEAPPVGLPSLVARRWQAGTLALQDKSRRLSRMALPSSRLASSASRQSGFSLVEISIALAVVSIGLVALLGLFGQSIQGAKASTEDSVQALYAKELLQQAKASDFSLSLSNSWANNGLTLYFTNRYASATTYLDGMGKAITNYDGTSAITNMGTLSGLKAMNRIVVESYNLGLTNLPPLSNSAPSSIDLALLRVTIYNPANSANPNVMSTQVFQTLIFNNQ